MANKKYKVVFFGTPDFSVPVLKTIISLPCLDVKAVVTQPDKPVGKKQTITPPPVKIIAKKNNIPVLQPKKIRTEQFEKKLLEIAPDVIIVVAYGKIIPEKLLAIPKHGWLNVHASLLPKYRGASPIQSAILNGIKKTGVTLMKIDALLDTGPIITQRQIFIEPGDNFQTLHDKLSRLGAQIIQEELLDYLTGKIRPKPQDNSQATLTNIIKKEHGRIDWNKPAEYIERQIRAFTPWPSAYCFWNGKHLKIIEAAVLNIPAKLSSGQTKADNDSIIVGCGQGNLKLKKIQLAGKKPLYTADFLKGYPEFGRTQLN